MHSSKFGFLLRPSRTFATFASYPRFLSLS